MPSAGIPRGRIRRFAALGTGDGRIRLRARLPLRGQAPAGLAGEVPVARWTAGEEDPRAGVDRARASAGGVLHEAHCRDVASADARQGGRRNAAGHGESAAISTVRRYRSAIARRSSSPGCVRCASTTSGIRSARASLVLPTYGGSRSGWDTRTSRRQCGTSTTCRGPRMPHSLAKRSISARTVVEAGETVTGSTRTSGGSSESQRISEKRPCASSRRCSLHAKGALLEHGARTALTRPKRY